MGYNASRGACMTGNRGLLARCQGLGERLWFRGGIVPKYQAKLAMPRRELDQERDLATLDRIQVERPRLYEVVLHNDDYTTQDFVVYVLMKFFQKDAATAREIMLHVHTKGQGVAGVYPRDIAESKAAQVIRYARENEMPLRCSVQRQSC